MILIAYDGSADAQAAVERVARLMPGEQAIVLAVWEPYLDVLTRTGGMGMGMAMGSTGSYDDSEGIDTANEETALATATEGAQRAGAAGLTAQPRCERRRGGIATAVLATAEELDADVIVMGTRGLGGVMSFLLGSVSHAVVQHADRAVLIVPSPTLAERRREHVRQEATPA